MHLLCGSRFVVCSESGGLTHSVPSPTGRSSRWIRGLWGQRWGWEWWRRKQRLEREWRWWRQWRQGGRRKGGRRGGGEPTIVFRVAWNQAQAGDLSVPAAHRVPAVAHPAWCPQPGEQPSSSLSLWPMTLKLYILKWCILLSLPMGLEQNWLKTWLL